MEFFPLIALILRWMLQIYTFVLWGRFVLEWVRVLNPRFRPRNVLLVIAEVVYTLTDPPIRLFRRMLPPIRLGSISLDLGWFLTMLCCWVLMGVLGAYIVGSR